MVELGIKKDILHIVEKYTQHSAADLLECYKFLDSYDDLLEAIDLYAKDQANKSNDYYKKRFQNLSQAAGYIRFKEE